MTVDILLTIVATAIVQSIFGAGVLLFGTPILLLLGYEFVEVLVILLPISLVINGLQIVKDSPHIDLIFYRRIVWLTLPPIALFLFLVTHIAINIGAVIGAFLLFISLKSFSPAVSRVIDRLMNYQKAYFVAMGAVHGVSNLGGSLLTAMAHHQNYPKNVARVTVAASYATFAAVQLITLHVFGGKPIDMPYYHTIIYATIASMVFQMADDMLFLTIDQDKFQGLFGVFLAASGLVLIAKSM